MSSNTKILLRKGDDEIMDKFQDDDLVETQVITDNQEYYEIMLVEGPQEDGSKEPKKIPIKIEASPSSGVRPNIQIKPLQSTKIMSITPKVSNVKPIPMTRVLKTEPITKIIKKGRKKRPPVIKPIEPVKILPKLPTNGNLFQYVDEPRQSKLDQLVEKILREYNNEIDVFFRSMAASVKKLQPNLIPKVKMEVCNVIAKYEMQSFVNQLSEV